SENTFLSRTGSAVPASAVLMLPSAVLTQVKGTHLAACGPLPVIIGKWLQPACSTAVQQDSPSVTTLLPAAKSRLASSSISFLRKPLTIDGNAVDPVRQEPAS